NEYPGKLNQGAATFRPSLAGNPPAAYAGYIQIALTPAEGESVTVRRIAYTTSAQYTSNPSSLELRSSADDYAAPLSTINLDQERTESVDVTALADGAAVGFRWIAGNAFGEKGGGAAGFSTNDVVIYGDM
ncbi:MAG: hypothetical protein KC417_12230, partial [Myxococcales bacterium]|nr:hypothetical protein [Myxococcales bacterium]